MNQRLFEILWLLTRSGGLTAGQLAQRFGVSRRTVYRDIDALSAAGIPVYAQRGQGGGLRLLPGYVIDKAMFSKEEQGALLANLQGLAGLGAPDTQATLDKLGALFGETENWLEVDFAPWERGEETRALFRILRGAILRRKLVQFHYRASSGPGTLRRVEPGRIVFRGQGWYLYGWCRNRQAFRFFKLSRMTEAEELAESFLPRPLPAATGSAPYTGPMVEVLLHFDSSAAFRVWEEFDAAQVAEQPDGSLLVHADMPAGEWLLGYLLSHGPALEVREPSALRAQMAAALKEMGARYRKKR